MTSQFLCLCRQILDYFWYLFNYQLITEPTLVFATNGTLNYLQNQFNKLETLNQEKDLKAVKFLSRAGLARVGKKQMLASSCGARLKESLMSAIKFVDSTCSDIRRHSGTLCVIRTGMFGRRKATVAMVVSLWRPFDNKSCPTATHITRSRAFPALFMHCPNEMGIIPRLQGCRPACPAHWLILFSYSSHGHLNPAKKLFVLWLFLEVFYF